mmetsp:Transcript_11181/g.18261  ORF Transcript_11181/g.18261 Transcript_11181/m.18261 type:complete len:319 (-) Transcript_11181:96-1052(-)|eukprot:CAMPEP_0184646780 /NCGR_PEP_ID=MMETSP0308-20130426/3569_1 /TAXON_ID=38269 /ORGANISM="Gloeochaete witrockiana, Strain SAG 46.84" /LENGTH=318 /DNA_ID=CAMNT_0027077143 /DNA_START=17 /DNA_END=973 /DNA_ORIENTATION=+
MMRGNVHSQLRPKARVVFISVVIAGVVFFGLYFNRPQASCASRTGSKLSPDETHKLSTTDRGNYAYVTLVTSKWYVQASQTLGYSLLKTHTPADMIAMVTSKVDLGSRDQLAAAGWTVRVVEPIANPNIAELKVKQHGDSSKVQINKRDTFADTYTKLHVWKMEEYHKIVFIDSDTVVVQNIDELFSLPELSAGMDCCDMFNSGVMVLAPSKQTFQDMMAKTNVLHSYDGGDQGFLNLYFNNWNLLPHAYNALQQQYLINKEAFRLDSAKVIHYVAYKPWLMQGANERPELKEIHEIWHRYANDMQRYIRGIKQGGRN